MSPRPTVGLTRRGFLTTSAMAATPFVLRGTGSAAPASDPDTLKVGLVGCGGRGSGAALQALNAEKGTVVLTAMADVFPDKIDGSIGRIRNALGDAGQDRVQVADDDKFSGFDGFQKLIDSGVDVVLLATPPHFRPEHLAAAIGAGKHVFCEKPMAVDAPGVRRVMEAAEEAKRRSLSLVSGFCWRYNTRMRAVYERIHSGAIGDIRAVYSTYNAAPVRNTPRRDGWSDMEWHIRNWQQIDWLSGDHIVEQAVHSLDKMAWAMKDVEPISVTSVGGRQAREGEASGNIYDHFGATFDYPNGVKAFHMSRQMYGCSNDNRDWVWGAKGNATIEGWTPLFEIDGENAWEYDGPGNDMYQQEHDELFASIRADKPMNDGDWMAKSTMLGVMIRMAAYTGQTITWEQAMSSKERLGPETYAFGEYALRAPAIPGKTKFV